MAFCFTIKILASNVRESTERKKLNFGLKNVAAVLTFTLRFLAYLGRLLGFISVDKVV